MIDHTPEISYPATCYWKPAPELAKGAFRAMAIDVTPQPADSVSPIDGELTTTPEEVVSNENEPALASEEVAGEAQPYSHHYNPHDVRRYADEHGKKKKDADKAIYAMYSELAWLSNKSRFIQLLEEKRVMKKYSDTSYSGKRPQKVDLPVDVLLEVLLELAPSGTTKPERDESLRAKGKRDQREEAKFAMIRSEVYDFFVGYCETVSKELDDIQ